MGLQGRKGGSEGGRVLFGQLHEVSGPTPVFSHFGSKASFSAQSPTVGKDEGMQPSAMQASLERYIPLTVVDM